MSDIAVRILANITRTVPKTVLKFKISLNIKAPTITLVMGSAVAKIDAFSPPIINVPCWKRTTAPTLIAIAKRVVKLQPNKVFGRVS